MVKKYSTIRTGFDDYIFDILRVLDMLSMTVAAIIAYYFRKHAYLTEPSYIYSVILCLALFLFISHGFKLYRLRKLLSSLAHLGALVATLIVTFLCYIALLYMLKSSGEISRLWVMYWFLLSVGIISVVNILFRLWFVKKLESGTFVRKIVIYGGTERVQHLFNEFKERQDIKILAIYVPEGEEVPVHQDIQILTQEKQLKQFCITENIDDILLATDMLGSKAMKKLLDKLRSFPCNITYCLPSAFFGKYIPKHGYLAAPIVTIYHRPMVGRTTWFKRTEDIVLGGLALIVAAPVMLTIMLLIRLTGEKDIFFKQKRGGFQGEEFMLYKFRSMKMHKENGLVEQASKDDVRVTKLGRILRKTSLDELPQIFNVLKGDMSLVGPRPHAISHDKHYAALIDSYAARHNMKPGITGWAQVNGWRGETDTLDKMCKRVEYDIHYIENWSLWLDIKVLFYTVAVFIPGFNKNVY